MIYQEPNFKKKKEKKKEKKLKCGTKILNFALSLSNIATRHNAYLHYLTSILSYIKTDLIVLFHFPLATEWKKLSDIKRSLTPFIKCTVFLFRDVQWCAIEILRL